MLHHIPSKVSAARPRTTTGAELGGNGSCHQEIFCRQALEYLVSSMHCYSYCRQVSKECLDLVRGLAMHISPRSSYPVPITESKLRVHYQDIRIIYIPFWYDTADLALSAAPSHLECIQHTSCARPKVPKECESVTAVCTPFSFTLAH